MLILGIETSCDESSAAVVEDGRTIMSNVVASQIAAHERFGGVVPEIASRQHVLAISGVVKRALRTAGVAHSDLDAIAATFGPGLSGALLVGTSFAKGMALGLGRPLIAVNHLEGHLLSVWLGNGGHGDDPPMPMVSLIASGGHTELVLIREPGRYQVLGRTQDDAAGEAFDKVGRLLGFAYPAGAAMEAAAGLARPLERGDSLPESLGLSDGHLHLELPRAWLPGTYDFSFSGLKTAAARMVRATTDMEADVRCESGAGPEDHADALSDGLRSNLARAFQDSVADVLTAKLAAAARDHGAASAAITGGVAANAAIRGMARERLDIPLFFPGSGLSGDNAAMIAGSAYWSRNYVDLDHEVSPSLAL